MKDKEKPGIQEPGGKKKGFSDRLIAQGREGLASGGPLREPTLETQVGARLCVVWTLF